MKKKSLMILGSSGFFGSSIIDYLDLNKVYSNKFNKIILISRKNKNKVSNKFTKKYETLQIKKDISKLKKIPYADYVIYSVITKNYSDDFDSFKNFVNLAKKFLRGSKILFTSSGAVYGNQSKTLKNFSEKRKLSPYDHASYNRKRYSILKYKSETEFKKLVNFNIKISIARCFAFVGKHLPLSKNFVIGNFIESVLNKKTITVKSEKKVIRSYMHSDELVFCFFKLLFDEKKNLKTFNIGSEDSFEIRDIAKKLSKKFKIPVSIKKIEDNKKLDKYIPNFSKFRKKYNYKKKILSYLAILKTIRELKNDRKI